MVSLSFVALAIAIGYLQGGRIGKTVRVDLNHSYLIWCALGLQVAIPILGSAFGDIIAVYGIMGHFMAYVLVVAFLLLNWNIRGLQLIAAGLICNLFAIVSGEDSLSTLKTITGGANGVVASLITLFKARPLWFLGDIFSLPKVIGNDTFSIGDILVGFGLFLGTREVLFTWSARPLFQVINRYRPKHLNNAQSAQPEEYSDIAS